MSTNTISSVSKGVFVFKGTKKRAKTEDYFASGDSGVDLVRKRILDAQWENINQQIHHMQNEVNTKLFDDLVNYVQNVQHRFGGGQQLLEIPTAALITGVNVSDHAGLFASLVRCVRGRATRHVAVLRSKDCPNVRSAVTKTLNQLVGHDDKLELTDDEDDQVNMNKISCTFDTLASWYAYACENSPYLSSPLPSPQKRPASPLTIQSPAKKPCSPRRKLLDQNVQVESPRKRAISPRKQYQSPRKETQSPRKQHQSPRKETQSPRKQLQSPRKGVQSPRKEAKTPQKSSDSPRKALKRKSMRTPPSPPRQNKRPPVVIVLEDLEGFSPNVLQDFVTICSNHLRELPLVLVFGIATAVTTVHRLLPSAVSSLMCIEKFQSPPSSEYLTQVIENVVINSDIPFKLGGKVFTLLLDLFLFHDFSVLNFISGLKLAMMEHFYSSPLSILCQPVKQSTSALNNMTKKQLERVKQVPSVASYIEGKSDKERKQISQDQEYAKSLLCGLLTSLDHYHRCFFPVLRCLHACTGMLPKYPLGKQVRELYATCLSSNVCDTTEYKDAIALLRTMSRDELLSSLLRCQSFLNNNGLPKAEFKEAKQSMVEFVTKLQDVDELSKLAHPEEAGDSEEELNLEAPKEKKLRLHDLKQKLQALEKKKKKVTVYEALRIEAIDLLDKMFRKYLSCPFSLPLHEVYYYNNATELRQYISASPRATMQRALAEPHYYVKHPSLKCDGDYISPSLPDTSIVYKLHLECGRLINLYDWMQAFSMIVQSGDEDSITSDAKVDKVIQARFIRAVSELQFLGFVKSTKRKTDHVARLTWGGC